MSDSCSHGVPVGHMCLYCALNAQPPRPTVSPDGALRIQVEHLERIAIALEKIQAHLDKEIGAWQMFAGSFEAKPTDTRCVGHVEGPVTDYHGDGQPIYGPGYRCNAPGTLCDDGSYRCEEHKKIRASYQKWSETGGRR